MTGGGMRTRRPRLRVDAAVAVLAAILWTASMGTETPVADAAMREDVDAVRELLQSGADVNAAQGDGMTALHWAAQHGEVELTEMLLYAGAHVGAATRLGPYTPLMVAARGGHGAVVSRLLAAGADVDVRTSTGVTALHLAAGSGSPEAVSGLLDHGAAVDARETAWEQTPLMWAADRGRVEVIGLLVLAGADVSAVSRTQVVKDLEAEDAVESRERRERMAEIRAQRLAEATAGGESWVDSLAAAAPADEPEDEPETEKPAEEKTEPEKAEAEEDRDAGAPVAAPEAAPAAEEEEARPLSYGELVGGHGGLSALHHAIREGHTAAVLALLDAGADIDAPTEGDGSSPLVLATINGHFDLGLELLARGADVNQASHAGVAPLFAAVNVHWAPKALYPQPKSHEQQSVTYLQYMERLLQAGADPDARVNRHIWFMSYNFDLLGVDMGGATPFWRAAHATDVQAMRLLVAHGADPDIPTLKPAERRRRGGEAEEDPSGLPPIPPGGPGVYPIHAASGVGYGKDYAANSHRHVPDGWLPAIRYLVEELGADVDARDYEGYTAVHHAATRGDNELIHYLVSQGADVTRVSRSGQTTADMANGPQQRVQPYPETVELLESLGSKNNHKCRSC